MAARLGATWVAAYVETPQHSRLSQAERGRLTQNLRQAELYGAEVVTLSGDAVAATVLAYARRCGITRIVLGKPTHPRWYDIVFGSVVEDIIRGSGDIDINVLTGEPGAGKTHTVRRYIAWLAQRGIPFAVTASTGIAATHLGGMTLHGWCGLGARASLDDAQTVLGELFLNELVDAGAFDRLQRLKRPMLRREETRGDKQDAKLEETMEHSVNQYAPALLDPSPVKIWTNSASTAAVCPFISAHVHRSC